MFASASTRAVNPHVYKTVPYDAVNGFTAISMVFASELMISVNPAVPANNLEELIQYAQANPGKLNFGSNVGSVLHLAGELFNDLAAVKITHVPYKNSGQALNGLIGSPGSTKSARMPPSLHTWWRPPPQNPKPGDLRNRSSNADSLLLEGRAARHRRRRDSRLISKEPALLKVPIGLLRTKGIGNVYGSMQALGMLRVRRGTYARLRFTKA
jgi:hypothetical protein